MLDKSCLNCREAYWDTIDSRPSQGKSNLPDSGKERELETGECSFNECIPYTSSMPIWLEELGEYEDTWVQDGVNKSYISKKRPYINCRAWQPRSDNYDNTGWKEEYPRPMALYGRRYDDDDTVGNVQVSPEAEGDIHDVKSDKVLNFTTVTGKEYVILIPKKLEEDK